MTSFEERFMLEDATIWQRTVRNIRLLRYLARLGWGWWRRGGAIRRAYRRAEARGETLWLD